MKHRFVTLTLLCLSTAAWLHERHESQELKRQVVDLKLQMKWVSGDLYNDPHRFASGGLHDYAIRVGRRVNRLEHILLDSQ